MTSKRVVAIFSLAFPIGLFLTACSTGPRPPQPGTPAFSWTAAREAYRIGDYEKVNTSLASVAKTDNEFTQRARAWEIISTAGLARAYSALADYYEDGAKKNRQNPTPFRKQVIVFRNAASASAVHCVEAYSRFIATQKDPNVPLAFELPAADVPEPVELKKVNQGMPLPEADLAKVTHAMMQRGVLLAATAAVGAKDDTAKGFEAVKTGQVPRDVFVVGVARALYDVSDLFGPKKLDQPNRVKMLCQQMMEGLKTVPANEQTKDLSGKIQTIMKKQKLI